MVGHGPSTIRRQTVWVKVCATKDSGISFSSSRYKIEIKEAFSLPTNALRLSFSAHEKGTYLITYASMNQLGKLLERILHVRPAGTMMCGMIRGLFL